MRKGAPTSTRAKLQAEHCKASGQPKEGRSALSIRCCLVFSHPLALPLLANSRMSDLVSLEVQEVCSSRPCWKQLPGPPGCAGTGGDTALQQLAPLCDYKIGAEAEETPDAESGAGQMQDTNKTLSRRHSHLRPPQSLLKEI